MQRFIPKISEDSPLALKILKLPYVVGVLSVAIGVYLVSFPLYLYLSLSQIIVCHKGFKDSSTLHLVLFIPRWIASVLGISLALAQLYFSSNFVYLYSESEKNHIIVTYIAVISVIVATSLSFWHGFKFHTKKSKFLPQVDGKEYTTAFLEAQKDILCFIINILVICGLVRIYQLFSWIIESPTNRKPYLQHSIHQLLFTVIDILVIPFLIIILIFPWRIHELKQFLKTSPIKQSQDSYSRKIIVEVACSVIVDIPFYLLAIPIFVTLWRASALIVAMKAEKYNYRRIVVLLQLYEWLLDLPFVLMTILLFITLIRAYSTYLVIVKEKTAKERRRGIFEQLQCLLLDSVALVCFLIVTLHIRYFTACKEDIKKLKGIHVHKSIFKYFGNAIRDLILYDIIIILSIALITITIWRLPSLYYSLKQPHTFKQRRSFSLEIVLCVLLDIPALLFYILLKITIWHSSAVDSALKEMHVSTLNYLNSSKEKKLKLSDTHFIIFSYFGKLIIDFPAMLCTVVVLVTAWRASTLLSEFKKCSNNRESKRSAAYIQLILLLLDIPTLLALIICVVTYWKYSEVSKILNEKKEETEEQKLLLISFNKGSKKQFAIWTQLGLLLVDIFFGLLMILLVFVPWRYYFYFIEIKKTQVTYWDKRIQVIEQFLQGIVDIISIFMGSILAISWRSSSMFLQLALERWARKELIHCNTRDYRLIVRNEFIQLLTDLPFAFMFALLLWRLPGAVKIVNATNIGGKLTDANYRRRFILKEFLATIQDVPYVPCYLFVLLTVWRFSNMRKAIKEAPTNSQKHDEILQYSLMVFFDLFCIFLVLVICVTGWRIRTLKELINVVAVDDKDKWKYHNAVMWAFAIWISDIPYAILFLLSIPAVWRLPSTIEYLLNKEISDRLKRKKVLVSFFHGFTDLLVLLLLVIMIITGWRITSLMREYKRLRQKEADEISKASKESTKEETISKESQDPTSTLTAGDSRGSKKSDDLGENKYITPIHSICIYQFWEWMCDLPYVPFGLVVIVTVYRVPTLLKKLKETPTTIPDEKKEEEKEEIDYHRIIFIEFFELLRDIPYAVLFCFLFWRLPFTANKLIQSKMGEEILNAKKRRKYIAQEFIETIEDIPYVIPFLLVTVTLWRFPFMITDIRKASSNKEKRTKVYSHFVGTAYDLLALLLIIVISITLWRIYTLYKKWKQPIREEDKNMFFIRHRIIVDVFKELVRDIPYVPFALVVIITVYRIPSLWYRMDTRCNTEDKKRYENVTQSVNILKDIIGMLMMLVILLFIWRVPSTVSKIQKRKQQMNIAPEDRSKEGSNLVEVEYNDIVISEFIELVVDVPYALLFCLLFWRLPSTASDLLKSKSAKVRREIIIKQFVELQIDIPYIPCFLFVVITIWRIPSLIKEYKKSKYSKEFREAIISQALKVLKDVVSVILGLVVVTALIVVVCFIVVTFWRIPYLYKNVKEALNKENKKDVHKVIIKVFIQSLIDIPYFLSLLVMSILGPWRIWRFVRYNLFDGALTDGEKRSLLALKYKVVFYDYLCLLLFVVLHITIWRIKPLWFALRNRDAKSNIYIVLSKQFNEWTLDIPYLPFGLVILITFYRFPKLLSKLNESKDERACRLAVSHQFIQILEDIFCLLLAIIITITLWRAPSFYHKFKRNPAHAIVYEEFQLLLLDILIVLQVLFIIVTVMHVQTLCKRLYNIWKLHKEAKSTQEYLKVLNTLSTSGYWMFPLLPEETKLEILSYLNAPSLCSISCVSKDLNRLCEDNILWKVLLSRDFQATEKELTSSTNLLKKLYEQKYRTWKGTRIYRGPAPHVRGMYTIDPKRDYKVGTRFVVREEFTLAIYHLHHTFLLPVKIMGLLLFPVYLYVKWRTNNIDNKCSISTKIAIVAQLSVKSRKMLNLWDLHKFFVIQLISLVLMLVNEIALVFVLFNCATLMILTLGEPFWKVPSILKKLMHWIQSITLPFVIALNAIFLFLPTILYNWSELSQINWELKIEILSTVWNNIHFSFLQIILQLSWLFIMFLEIEMLTYFRNRYFKTYDSFYGYRTSYRIADHTMRWVLKIIYKGAKYISRLLYKFFVNVITGLKNIGIWIAKKMLIVLNHLVLFVTKLAGNILRINYQSLAVMTRFCKRTGNLGELLLIPIVFMWIFWPLVTSILYYRETGGKTLLIPGGWKIVDANWTGNHVEKPLPFSPNPVLEVSSIIVESPAFEGHGLKIILSGKKPKGFSFKQARLLMDGQKLWDTLDSMIGAAVMATFKFTFYPITLTPNFLNASDIIADQETFTTSIKFGTGEGGSRIKFKDITLLSNLESFCKKGDPSFDMIIESGVQGFASFNTQNILIKMKVKASWIIEAIQTRQNLISIQEAHKSEFEK